MFKAMNKYYEINFDKITDLKDIILKENIEITCVNSSGISIIIPGSSVDVLIEEKDNILLKDAKYYISSFSSKFFNLNNPNTNKSTVVAGADDSEYSETEYFYHIYKNCESVGEKLKSANSLFLNRIIREKPNNRLSLLKPYLDELKLDSKANKIAKELNVPYIQRDVFLDNEDDVNYVKKQLESAVKLTQKKGFVIAIGHPRKNTFKALEQSKDLLKSVDLVYLSEIYGK